MDKNITVFGQTTFRNQLKKFGIKTDDRRRHMYLIGKTGMGKSTVLENMIISDIRAGRGVAVVDPHGDLAEKVIEYIPTNRINDVIYFNPADAEYPIAFNIVEQVDASVRHLVASGLVGVFKKLWADSWGPRLEYILRNAILAVLDYPGATLLAVIRMLSDKPFRKKIVENIQDPVVKAFWINEFAGYADKFASEAVSPIQNKVGQFLSTSLIRNIVGQISSSIQVRDVMDKEKILIMNLSKGRIGEDNSALLGAMMITKIQLAAMSRVDVPQDKRKDFYLYIDEFQNFTTEAFANILSEARKYHLNLIMAHQYIEQLGDVVKAAVFGNVGTLVVFRVGAADAEELVKEFTPVFNEEDLVNLPKYEMYLKLMIDGIASDPFSARGLPPLTEEEKTGNTEKMIKVSRERYASNRKTVEDKIMRWHGVETQKSKVPFSAAEQLRRTDKNQKSANKQQVINEQSKSENLISDNKIISIQQSFPQNSIQPQIQRSVQSVINTKPAIKEEVQILNKTTHPFEVTCSRCNKQTRITFRPDGIRPVFCKECLSILKKERREIIKQRKKAKQEKLTKQQTADSRQQIINNRQQTINNSHFFTQTANNKQQKNWHQTTNNQQNNIANISLKNITNDHLIQFKKNKNNEKELKEGEEVIV